MNNPNVEFNFEDIMGQEANNVTELMPFPTGTFRAVLTQVKHLVSSQKGTNCIAFGVKPLEVVDADENELEDFGDWSAFEFKPRATVSALTFFITGPDSRSYIVGRNKNTGEYSGFVADVVGLTRDEIDGRKVWAGDENGNAEDCLMLDCVGREVNIDIVHEMSDNGKTYATIDKVHAAD